MSMQEQISTELANETVSSQAAIVFPPLGVKYCWVCTAVLPWGGSPLDGFLGHRSKACVFSPTRVGVILMKSITTAAAVGCDVEDHDSESQTFEG